jgi:hypothetical protein
MSVVAVFRWKGDPDALLAAYDRELQHAVPREQPRRVTHICARSDNGVVIVDLWETEEDLQRMMENPEFQRNLEAAGWPSAPIVQTYQVHATIPSRHPAEQGVRAGGGDDGTRTHDPLLAKQVLFQLSYIPEQSRL